MGWNPTTPADNQWKASVYWNKQSQALEQDHAAGARSQRRVTIPGSHGALARVILKRRHRTVYAELRWQVDNKQYSRFLCRVRADNRTANLAHAWKRAHELGLTGLMTDSDECQATSRNYGVPS